MLAAMAGNDGREWHPTAAAAARGCGAGHPCLPGHRLAGRAAPPGRPGRPGPADGAGGVAVAAGLGDLGHGGSGAGHPPAPAPGGLAAARAGRYASHALLAGAGPLPGARWAALFADIGWIRWPAAIGFVLLLTPTGSPPSPRWRWWVWLAAAAPPAYMLASVMSPLAVPGPAGDPADRLLRQADGAAALVVLVSLLVGAVALLLRFRRAGPSGCSCAGSPWPPSWPGWPRPWWWSAPAGGLQPGRGRHPGRDRPDGAAHRRIAVAAPGP